MVMLAGVALLLVALLAGGQAPPTYDCSCFCGEPQAIAGDALNDGYNCLCDCTDVVGGARAAATAASGYSEQAESYVEDASDAISTMDAKMAEANAAIGNLTAEAILDAGIADFRSIMDARSGVANTQLGLANTTKTAARTASDAAEAAADEAENKVLICGLRDEDFVFLCGKFFFLLDLFLDFETLQRNQKKIISI